MTRTDTKKTVKHATPGAPVETGVWRKNIIILSIVAVAETLLLWNNAALDRTLWLATRWFMGDQQPYNWNAVKVNPLTHPHAPWWRVITPPFDSQLYHQTESSWRALRDVGVPLEVIFFCVLVAVYSPYRLRAAGVFLGSILGAGAVSEFFKSICGRVRPIGPLPSGILNDGHNVWQWFRGLHTQQDLSFPSGHACVAFAMAAALTYLSPRGRWLFLTVAWLTSISRVVMQAHFYSDIIFGGTIGWFCGFGCAMWVGDRLNVPQARLPVPGEQTPAALT